MKIAILDDEVHCIESLVIHLNSLYPNAQILYKTNRVQEALEKLPKIDIDLLFLDIEMPNLNGFQFLEQLPERKFDVIFTTAYSQYAVKAFKSKAINYLLKPIDEEELKEAIDEWHKNLSNKDDSNMQIERLMAHMKKEGVLRSKIAVPIADGFEFVEVDEIMYCQSQSNYSVIFLSSDRKITISKTLKEVENTLNNFYFLRVHQSYLINPNFLKKYNKKDGGTLTMQNNEEVPISPKKRELITNLFEAIHRK